MAQSIVVAEVTGIRTVSAETPADLLEVQVRPLLWIRGTTPDNPTDPMSILVYGWRERTAESYEEFDNDPRLSWSSRESMIPEVGRVYVWFLERQGAPSRPIYDFISSIIEVTTGQSWSNVPKDLDDKGRIAAVSLLPGAGFRPETFEMGIALTRLRGLTDRATSLRLVRLAHSELGQRYAEPLCSWIVTMKLFGVGFCFAGLDEGEDITPKFSGIEFFPREFDDRYQRFAELESALVEAVANRRLGPFLKGLFWDEEVDDALRMLLLHPNARVRRSAAKSIDAFE